MFCAPKKTWTEMKESSVSNTNLLSVCFHLGCYPPRNLTDLTANAGMLKLKDVIHKFMIWELKGIPP